MRCLFFLFFSAGLTGSLAAQTLNADSSFLKQATQYAVGRYEQAIGGNELLYNGIEHIGYDPRLKVDPYFRSDSLKLGSIHYRDRDFVLPMLYDLVKDVLIVEHPAGYRLELRSDQVNSFSLLGHTFVRLPANPEQAVRAGFYDVLYKGPSQLLARRTKIIRLNPTANGGYGQFEPATTYYLRRKDRYYVVKNRKTLLTALADQKKQLMVYARKQRIRFRPDLETAITTLTKQYDKLTHSE